MKFHPLNSDRPIYSMNPDRLFTAASSFKVFPGSTAFSTLGPGYRFRTRVYCSGPIVKGVLKGDLVLVAGGDLLLGGRIQRDGTLALLQPDHTYGGKPLPGDPLQQLRHLARQVRARGIRRIEGRVVVDASLFRQASEDIANGGIRVPVSPMMINDNVVDVSVRPGANVGASAVLRLSPEIGYVRISNEVRTIAPSSPPEVRRLRFIEDVTNPDGTQRVKLTGDIRIDSQEQFIPYHIPGPVRFAEIAFTRALQDCEIGVDGAPTAPGKARRPLAEWTSPPLSEEIKVMLKSSSNIHTVHFPYLTGAIAGGDGENAKQRGEDLQRQLFRQAGLNPDPPGASEGKYTADFFVPFLAHVAKQRYFSELRRALPIMGRDGTLADVQVNSPAAGQVYAKTGTGMMQDPTGKARIVKALAGYIRLPNGSWVAFAEFMEQEADVVDPSNELIGIAGEALGEIATAVYEEA